MVSFLPNPANHKRIRLGSSFIYSGALKSAVESSLFVKQGRSIFQVGEELRQSN
jgi:hypothetical protein